MNELVNNADAWDALITALPGLLRTLREESVVYGNGKRPPSNQRGVYLFSKEGRDLYVGRTSVTARARRAGKNSSRNFSSRYGEHTNDGSPPGSAPFAARIARDSARQEGFEVLPPDKVWWALRKAPAATVPAVVSRLSELFLNAKRDIASMECRVLPVEDDVKGVRSTLIELYVHVQLDTPYNDFSTS